MRRFLLLFLPFVSFAQGLPETEVFGSLTVTWIDENTVQVSGYGNGGGDYTNSLGSCTNCLAITPDEMHEIKVGLLRQVDDSIIYNNNIAFYASSISNACVSALEDISTFRRFLEIPVTSSSTSSNYVQFTNYVYGVNNVQTSLDRSHRPSSAASQPSPRAQWMAYNNGIYDYANDFVKPTILEGDLGYASDVLSYSELLSNRLSVIRSTVDSITEDACESCGSGGGTNSSSSSSCPCEEQFYALVDYVRHIDEDQHRRFLQLSSISNNISNIDNVFDGYAKLVSGVLYNDATIVVDDGENSWSNVYNTGRSQLYYYDKSNILQRIELLLYGLVSNASTNWGSATSDFSGDVEDMQDAIDEVRASVADANAEYASEVSTISQKVTALFNALNFFGSGSLGNFAYGEPMQFDVYDFQFDFTNAADFRPLQQVCRTALQIFYWTAGVVFMLVFWYRVVKFTTDFALRIIHFFNNLLT